MVEKEFGYVRVRGEVSGYKRAASGHVYLTLKDDKSVLDGVMWKGNAGRLPFNPEDGLEIVASGKLTTYAGRSKYQLVVDKMELAGEGALMQLFEKLKAKLLGEGLFDEARKKPIPFLPRTIGVVTSPTGSVIRDILHRLADRCPSHVIVWPVLVQGSGAEQQIADAINGFNALKPGGEVARPDLIIVARGGGSIEDLWSFNEEIVVRAIAGSTIPLISAVGHETDTTLADFAADLRAPTPTAAAEMAVPVREEWLNSLADTQARMSRAVLRGFDRAKERLEAQQRLIPALPDLLRPHQQRLDDCGDQMAFAMQKKVSNAQNGLASAAGGLRPNLLLQKQENAAAKLQAIWRLAEQLHPDRPLARGYARVSAPDGDVVASAAAAREAVHMALNFADGAVDVAPLEKGKSVEEASSSPVSQRKKTGQPVPKKSSPKKTPDSRQQDLF